MEEYVTPQNGECWAIGTVLANGRFHVRRIVWGQLMAKAEKRAGEKIRKAAIYIRREAKP
jgi:hypothetical protein